MALLVLPVQPVAAEVVVIVHPGNPVNQLSREQVVDLYMGRQTQFPDGRHAMPLDQAPESSIREEFYQKLVDKSVAQINSFWARLFFSGRATPPRVLPDAAAILSMVAKNPDAIAYIDSKNLDGRHKIVFRLP